MRLRLFQIAACLWIGVVLTIATAWWCVGSAQWRGRWSAPGSDPQSTESISWLRPGRGEPAPNTMWISTTFGGRKIEVSRMEPLQGAGADRRYAAFTQRAERAGWPLLALEARSFYPIAEHAWKPRHLTKNVWINSFEQGLCFTGPASRGQVVLPLVPRWGFVVNMVFYGALVWGIGAGLAGVRRSLRRRRGRCPTCNYDLMGLAACPECGREVRRRT